MKPSCNEPNKMPLLPNSRDSRDNIARTAPKRKPLETANSTLDVVLSDWLIIKRRTDHETVELIKKLWDEAFNNYVELESRTYRRNRTVALKMYILA